MFEDHGRSHKQVSFALPLAEWAAMRHLARKNNVKLGAYLRAIIIDAIADEGLDVRRFGPPPSEIRRAPGEASGAPTT